MVLLHLPDLWTLQGHQTLLTGIFHIRVYTHCLETFHMCMDNSQLLPPILAVYWHFCLGCKETSQTFSVRTGSDQSLSRVRLLATPWIIAHQASLSITNSRSSLRLRSMESMMPSSHLILWCPLLLLPLIPPSIRVFSNESALCMRWPKDWSFSFSIIPSKEIPGLISFRMDWLDLLEVQGFNSKISILKWGIVNERQYFRRSLHLKE